MSIRVSVRQLQEQLPELLNQAVESGEEFIVQRDGKDYAVIVSADEWERRTRDDLPGRRDPSADQEEARILEIGRKLDALGPGYRLSEAKRLRRDELLDKQQADSLTPQERGELEALVRESEEVMLRRAEALDRIL